MVAEKEKAYVVIRDFSNEKLIEMLIEIRKISNHENPSSCKMSKDMFYLFYLEKNDYNYWLNQFNNVKLLIESEILHRIETNNLKTI